MLASASVAWAQGAAGETVAASPAAQGYRLGVGDKFRLTVYNEDSINGQEFTVGQDGTASLPLIGAVALVGKTPREAEAAVAARYAAGFLNNPRVNIEVTNFRPYYILGEVNKPGEYPYAPGMTVLNAVARAEGFTYRASEKRVLVRHSGGGETRIPLTADTPVLPGDTIRVVERFF